MRTSATRGANRGSWVFPIRLIVALAALVLIVGSREALVRPLLTVRIPEPVTVAVQVRADGFSVYDEDILLAPLSGEVQLLVSEGEVVPRGSPVVRLLHPHREAYERRLRQVRAAARTWRDLHEEQLPALNSRLIVAAREAERAALSVREGADPAPVAGALDEFARVRDSLMSLWGEWDMWRDRVEELRRLRDAAAEEIPAPRPGAVRTEFDGFERLLAWDAPLTGQLGETLESAVAGANVGVPSRGDGEVRAGEPLLRIQDHLRLDAILLLPADAPAAAQPGGRVALRADDTDRTVSAVVREVLPRDGESDIVRVSLDEEMPHFFRHRHWAATLEIPERAGHRLTAAAVVTRRGSPGVFLWRNGEAQWREIGILRSTDEEIVAAGLPEGVAVVQNPRLLQLARLE